jgi:hypothetical protein
MDNDGDGLIDCNDPNCNGRPACLASAPAMSPPNTLLLAVLLTLVGLIGLARMRAVNER